jgi:holliday junction DNA helicase RuvB
VGLEAIAATINDEAETLSELVEPYLLKIGFIVRTPNGRRVTREAYRHLGKQPPAAAPGQQVLFE